MRYVSLNQFDSGSTGEIAKNIIKELIKRGHECFLVSNLNKSNDVYYHRFPFNYLEYNIGRIINKIDGSDGFNNILSTKKLVKWLTKVKPDVIHLHNLHGHWINIPVLFEYIALNDVKVIWTFHDCWPLTGRCAHFDYNNCEKWKSGCYKCKFKPSYPRTYLFDRCAHFYKIKKDLVNKIKDKCIIISPSKWLDGVVSNSMFREFQHKVIYNGVDFSRFNSNKNFTRDKKMINKKIILSIAFPFTKMKGIEYIEKCIVNFSNKEDYLFVLIGLNKKQLKRFSKYKNCLPLGPIFSKETISYWYSVSDLFLNPTLEEVLGLTNIEASYHGLPTVVFKSGGACETISNYPQFHVNRGDIEDLISKIICVSKTPELSKSLRNTAENFNLSYMIDSYVETILALLETKR